MESETYSDICLRWKIEVLVEILGDLLGVSSRVEPKRLRVAPRWRATAHIARWAAAHRTRGSAHIARWGGPRSLGALVRGGHMRAAHLGSATRVRARGAARVVGTLGASVGRAIKRRDLEVAAGVAAGVTGWVTRHVVLGG